VPEPTVNVCAEAIVTVEPVLTIKSPKVILDARASVVLLPPVVPTVIPGIELDEPRVPRVE
jgi:hypothetical protein